MTTPQSGFSASDVTTRVIDAGGRYGVHPSWRGFRGEMAYYIFEPDQDEASRLEKKYASRESIEVFPIALAEREGKIRINVLRHRGQSTSYVPNLDSVWFGSTREGEGEVTGSYDVATTTVDAFCARNKHSVDFLKIDTEGHELAVLQGSEAQLRTSILGVRAEVHFDAVFHGAPLFSSVHDFMLERGYFLLNLDYNGKGAHKNGFVEGHRYGALVSCDAVWLKRYETAFSGCDHDVDLLRVVKYAAFCVHNHATDVAIDVLLYGLDRLQMDYSALAATGLWRHLDVSMQRLFNSLKYQPHQDPERMQQVYTKIFGRDLKQMHEFYESDETNPD